MTTKTTAALLLFLLAPLPASSQDVILLPGGLHFAPLRANLQEPRIGLVKSLDAGDMRVDIGNTADLIRFRSGPLAMTVGIDFFAYALVAGSDGLRLQIEAVDGFFGGNVAASLDTGAARWTARLRLLHHSAHLVDAGTAASLPFTRDFGELVVARQQSAGLRIYAGISYATLVRPSDIGRFAYLAGLELAEDGVVGPVAGQPVQLFAAYSASLNGTPVYALTHTLQAGVKLGQFFGKGASVFAEWYIGRHMLAEYYDRRMSFIGIGFAVDFL